MLANKRGWKIAAVGECMLARVISECDEPEFLKLKEMLHNADAAYGHLEMNFGNRRELCAARGGGEGGFLLADARIAGELRTLGLNMVSLAGDHSFDFGPEGVLSTRKACRAAGLSCAGTGRDREEAREAAWYESAAGRVALISASSGNVSNEWANLPKGSMRARCGPNPLRVRTRYKLPADMAECLRDMAKQLTVLREYRPGAVSKDIGEGEFRVMLPSEQSTHGAAGTVSVFASGEDYAAESFCHKEDLQGNLASIREASSVADFVIAAHHFNIADNERGDQPPMFAAEFAHAAIDAGADVYFGHGWNKTLGVEIYKNKPIFYGLGNFFAQAPFACGVPYDSYDARGFHMDWLPALHPMDEPLYSDGGYAQNLQSLTSAVAVLEYTVEKRIRSITFYPVELGVDLEREQVNRFAGMFAEGRPFLASGVGAQRILKRLQSLSAAYGTEISISDGIGRWEA